MSIFIEHTEGNHYEKHAIKNGQDKIKTQVLCLFEFFDAWFNKTKNVNIRDYYIIYRSNRRIRASNKSYSVKK